MDLHKAARDPWVWGQFALIVLVAVVAPVSGHAGCACSAGRLRSSA